MIQVEVQPADDTHPGTKQHLILNGRLIEESDAGYYWKMPAAQVYDEEAITLLQQCRLAEIANHFARLTLRLKEPPHDDMHSVEIQCRDHDNKRVLWFNFHYNFDLLSWSMPYSITEFASTLERVVEGHNYPGVYYDHIKYTTNFGTLMIELNAPEETVQEALERWVPIIKDIWEETNVLLVENARKDAVVALFLFAPEVKTACEQYLLYFVQFLEDFGIQATADLHEQARGVLFTVTPESGSGALERIREALDVYLEIPRSPDFDIEVTRHTNIAVQQYAANVFHLRSQLALAQAVLETKNATIEALQAANLQYKQILSANSQSHGQLPAQRTDDPQRDEPILGGAVTLGKLNKGEFKYTSASYLVTANLFHPRGGLS